MRSVARRSPREPDEQAQAEEAQAAQAAAAARPPPKGPMTRTWSRPPRIDSTSIRQGPRLVTLLDGGSQRALKTRAASPRFVLRQLLDGRRAGAFIDGRVAEARSSLSRRPSTPLCRRVGLHRGAGHRARDGADIMCLIMNRLCQGDTVEE